MEAVETIFFDFDGVILDSVAVKGQAFARLFQDYPEHVDAIVAYHHANGGMPRFDKFRYIYREILGKPLSEEEFQRLCDGFSRIVWDLVMACPYVPGAREFLEEYYRDMRFFIVSGTPHEEIQLIVEARGLSRYFHGVYGSPTTKGEWVRTIMGQNSLDPAGALFVGDAMSDYKAARENGIRFVARVADPADNLFAGLDVDLEISDLQQFNRFLKQDQ